MRSFPSQTLLVLLGAFGAALVMGGCARDEEADVKDGPIGKVRQPLLTSCELLEAGLPDLLNSGCVLPTEQNETDARRRANITSKKLKPTEAIGFFPNQTFILRVVEAGSTASTLPTTITVTQQELDAAQPNQTGFDPVMGVTSVNTHLTYVQGGVKHHVSLAADLNKLQSHAITGDGLPNGLSTYATAVYYGQDIGSTGMPTAWTFRNHGFFGDYAANETIGACPAAQVTAGTCNAWLDIAKSGTPYPRANTGDPYVDSAGYARQTFSWFAYEAAYVESTYRVGVNANGVVSDATPRWLAPDGDPSHEIYNGAGTAAPAAATTLTATPSTTTVVAAYANIHDAAYYDWVAVAAAGSSYTSFEAWVYTLGEVTGSRTLAMPTQPGNYVIRLFRDNGYTLVLETAPFTVEGSTCTITANYDPSTQTVTTTYNNGPGNYYDWVAISYADSPNTSYHSWEYVFGATSGTSGPMAVPTGTNSMVARLYVNNGYTIACQSNSFTTTN